MAIIPTSGEFTKVPEGGGGSAERFVVTLTPNEDFTGGTSDKTTGEMREAFNQNKAIWFNLIDLEGNTLLMPLSGIAGIYGFSVAFIQADGSIAITFSNGSSETTDFALSVIPLGS